MESPADVVHAHAYGHFPTIAGSFGTALDHGAALVITPHSDSGTPSWSKSIFDRLVSPMTVGRASRVIAVSRHEAQHLSSIGVPTEKIRIIPNGVDLGEFDLARRRVRTTDTVRGLFVGRLDPDQKGLTTLIRAVALLPASIPLEIRLVGEDWGANDSLRSLARRLGVQTKVILVGRLERPALLAEYSAADFLVLPSRFEPFGIVLLEAMAAGLPVVASRVGGIPEVVEEGRTGILVEPANPHALAEGLREICQDENRRRAMANEALHHVRTFGWEAIVPQVLSTYQEAVEDRGG
jgi:glycosyltransferase involved in cell wall biosynthesis